MDSPRYQGMVRAGAMTALAVHEYAGLATLALGKPAAPGLTAAGGLLWASGKLEQAVGLLEAGLSFHL